MGRRLGKKKKATMAEKRAKAKANVANQEHIDYEPFSYRNIYYEQFYKHQ